MRRSTRMAGRPSDLAQKLLTVGLVLVFLVIAGAAGLFVFDQVRQFIAASDMLPDFTIEHTESEDVVYEPG